MALNDNGNSGNGNGFPPGQAPVFGRREEGPVPPENQPPRHLPHGDAHAGLDGELGAGYTTPQQARSPQEILKARDVPPPPKRSRQARHGLVVFANFCLSIIVLVMLAMGAAFWFGKQLFEEEGPLLAAKTVVIQEGSGLSTIASRLESAGIIDNQFIFRQGVRASGNAASMKAGEYAFKPGMSMRDVMDTIVSGRGIIHKVTIPEGFTSFQIIQRLAENEILEGDLPDEIPPEGSLMPDTYPFQRGTTRAEVLEQMRRSQQRFLAEVWERRIDGLPISTPEEMVVLASIVEKETGKADERPLVAGVFINRLNKGMRLQSDPTIIYGIFGGKGKPSDRPIFRSDIDTRTDYNTYQIDGLPPGPIANPGRAALEAVANPSRTTHLFFVADGTGGHVFAETLAEHEANVKRWRAIEAQLREEAERAAAQSQQAGEGNGSEATDTAAQ